MQITQKKEKMFSTPLHSVSLATNDLQPMVAFYSDILGFTVRQQDDQSIWLGTEERPLLHLKGSAREKPAGRKSGLYHFALRLPTRRDLARQLSHLRDRNFPLQGFADHGVSEAVYLQDPAGNGLELYWDRPREAWPMENGQLQMTTRSLNTRELLELVDPSPGHWQGLPNRTMAGHIHLQVNNLSKAVKFYQDVLGFDLQQRYGTGAAFLSYDSYHHHIGINTWNSKGAPALPLGAPGLRWFTLQASPRMDLSRVQASSIPEKPAQEGQLIQDPAGNRIRIVHNRPNRAESH